MSNLYEELGEQEKSLQFALIAAHLAPQDPEEWARLADMSLEMEDIKQAVLCYRKGQQKYFEILLEDNIFWAKLEFITSQFSNFPSFSELSRREIYFFGTKPIKN